ncbi:Dehydrogenase/reductase SDR family member 7B [Fukomys damarensis]|uniref:Dehydrogenase/reductase SDR family member 7B n=1 Tax=Fukomys damarensis TaxID=885580 RepID=A0A091DL97_FUKDA|nr:Dehydrogenase/reductase SDR family member 7B [Fukomys damarensis]
MAVGAEILQCFGHVDILINNAGISYHGVIMDTTVDVDKKIMETNYFGPVALTKVLLLSMIKRSLHSLQACNPGILCMHDEMEQDEIKMTVISHGYVHTNLSVNAVTSDGQEHSPGQSPAKVAQNVLAALREKKKDMILADWLSSLAIYLHNLAPGLFFSIMASRARKEQKSKNS